MENEVKQRNQRNRRRERAQRMQAQRESKVKDGDSGEDESPAREKPPRPPTRRKKSREPLGEEDIIDGFAIMAFRTYEDLEAAVKCASSPRTNSLSTKPRLPLAALPGDATRNHPPNNVNSHGITLLQDAGTSDDSGRASERLTGSSVAPRDPDSSRDRLSDASSRCSSGKGYICDSEGDDDKASPDNSRNVSPRYHDASMEDVSDAGSLFRVTGAGGVAGAAGAGAAVGGAKNELVARGGSGGALALSRAPVGGSASPAPAPLPQPAPSPAPAALPPPALPPPPFRADTPHRPNGAHIPALDGHAATQIPARPVGAAGPDTPERPASNNKLQPGARAAADSPTPAPPAPPAPSPLFPSHTAYQAHAAPALPDFRHTNHETRTEPGDPPAAPLDLHAHHAPRPPHPPPPHPSLPSRVPHSQPHPVMPGHDVRNAPAAAPPHPSVPISFPSRVNGVAPPPPHSAASSTPSCLPSSQPLAARPLSPAAPASRPYPAPSIGSSHINSSLSSSIHGHSIPFQSQSSLQKHSVQSVYTSRPPHLAPFTVPNHVSSNHIPSSVANQPTAAPLSHPINSHSIVNHVNHLPSSNSNSLATSTPNHIGPPLSLPSTTASSISSFTPSLKHPSLGLPPHPAPIIPPVTLHQPQHNHVDALSVSSGAPTVVTTSSHSLPPVIDSRQPTSEAPRSEAVVSSALAANGFPPPAVYSGATFPPLYAPYATTLQHSPYLPPAAASPRNSADTRTSLSASPLVAPKTPKGVRPHTPGSTGAAGSIPPHAPHSYSPRGHSPSRERESFSSNISSLSRSTPASASSAPLAPTIGAPLPAPLATPLATPLAAPLAPLSSLGGLGALGAPLTAPLAAPTPTPAAPGAHLAQSLAPVPTVPSISSSAKPPAHWGVTRPDRGFAPAPPLFGAPLAPPNPNPFSAESLFQTSPSADLLRRELDSRFLAAAGAAGARTEMHHHQHQHTHVHQHPHHHPHQLLHPHSLFKDVSKMSSLYRGGVGVGVGLGLGYPYSSSLLPAPYPPPAPLAAYAPKPVVSAAGDSATKPPPRPAVAKTGKWNAMHVRIAWEIYNHQQKEKTGGAASGAPGATTPSAAADKDKLRAFPAPAPPPAAYRSPYDLPAPYLPHHPHLGSVRYPPDLASSLAPPTDRGLRVSGMSPFARYGAGAFPGAPAAFGLYGRDLALSSSLHAVHHAPLGAPLHDAWRPRAPAPPAVAAAAAEARRDHEERERERARRERDDRERRERDERERRKQREHQHRERELERARARSPLRNGPPEPERQVKDERKEPPRPPPPSLPAYPPPPPWGDPYRAFDPLQHMRFAPIVEAAIRAEEDRHKMLSAYAHHQQLKAAPLLHRGLGHGLPLHPGAGVHAHPHSHSHAHAPLAPLPPLAPPLAPLAPLDLLKKEEPR
ncbi:fibrosin-1-like protein isoform X1 [Leguminivora glycinivorella]|uniref:fibrosin-1-like protein isoform X1 n=2 Tax=Leguminivora glycinivorella TaxID=1035111 RepID=UPI00200C51A4|nr:fibrosin-1-like protein isoform X1 [Leguminivora glycinivorella]